jgi:serine/threonine protein phosphatase PrpC
MLEEIAVARQNSLFQTANLSEPGGRDLNEDTCDFAESGTAACWVMADGLGGHRGGELASQTAAKAILESFSCKPEFSRAALQQHIAAAQDAVRKAQDADPVLASMRTTAVVLLTDSRQVLWAHVGDSRLYQFRKRGLAVQTEDHSVPQALVKAGEITPDQIRGHGDRNRLLRSIGEKSGVQPAVLDTPSDLLPGDAFLLCTDGFWEYVYETEMLADLVSSASPDEWLQRAESRLLSRVTGGHDNYSAIGIFFGFPVYSRPVRTEPTDTQVRISADVEITHG